MLDLKCLICNKKLDPTAVFTYIPHVGHFCTDCRDKIKEHLMVTSYGGNMDNEIKNTMVLDQDHVDALLRGLAPSNDKKELAVSCLEEAAKIINGNRQDDYGTPEDSFKRIADYWTSYLHHKCFISEGLCLVSSDVAMLMVLFKIAREEHSHKHDNLVDICGYTAILDNMYQKE